MINEQAIAAKRAAKMVRATAGGDEDTLDAAACLERGEEGVAALGHALTCGNPRKEGAARNALNAFRAHLDHIQRGR